MQRARRGAQQGGSASRGTDAAIMEHNQLGHATAGARSVAAEAWGAISRGRSR